MRKATGRTSCAVGFATLLAVSVLLGARYLSLVSRIPPPPSIPVNLPTPNALDSYLAAGAYLPKDLPPSTRDLDKLPIEGLRRLVNSGQPALTRLRSGLKQSFGIHVPPSFDTLLPETSVFRKLGRLQYAEAVYLERQGQVDEARQGYLRLTELGTQLSHGGVLIHALIALRMQQDGLRGLERLSFRFGYQQAAGTVSALERLEAGSATAEEVVQRHNLHEQAAVVELMGIARNGTRKQRADYHIPWIAGWDTVYAVTPKSKMLASFRQYGQKVAAHSSTPYWSRPPWPVLPNDPVNQWVGLTYEDPVFNFDLTQVCFRLVEARLAAHAYRQLEHRQPRRLEDLPPKFLQTVQDPFSGKPLRLKHGLTKGSALIYSVGPDEKDDGGRHIKTGIGRTSIGDVVEIPTR